MTTHKYQHFQTITLYSLDIAIVIEIKPFQAGTIIIKSDLISVALGLCPPSMINPCYSFSQGQYHLNQLWRYLVNSKVSDSFSEDWKYLDI